MATPFLGGRFQAIGAIAGGVVVPVPGAALYSYEAGTLTPAATYTSPAATSSNANPVICDASGQADVWLDARTYRMRLYTRPMADGGVLLWDEDGIVGDEAHILSAGLRADLAGTAQPTQGAGGVAVSLLLPYAAGTLGALAQDGPVNVAAWLTEAERAQVRLGNYGADLTGRLSAARGWAGDRPLHLLAGAWSTSSADLKGNFGGLVGDGQVVTTVKARSVVPAVFDALETVDTIVSPLTLHGFSLDGDGKAVAGIDVRLRHHYELADLLVKGCTTVGVKEKDTWLARHWNVRITQCPIGHWLVGSNHSSQFYSSTITACTNVHLLIEAAGSAMDGNDSLSWYGLEVSDGSGAGIDDAGTSTSFYGCYLGENVGGTVFTNRIGTAIIDGGTFFFGATATSFGFAPAGGLIKVRGVRINGQSFASLNTLVSDVAGGSITFEGCQFNFPLGGDPLVRGDPFGYGPAYRCFAPTHAKGYTATAVNCTLAQADGVNVRNFAITAVAAGTRSLYVSAPLLAPDEWLEGSAFILITYRSTIDFNVRLAGGTAGASPTRNLATLPATAGELRTFVKLDSSLDRGSYTILEIYSDAAVVGASLELTSVHFSDRRMPAGSLWKC